LVALFKTLALKTMIDKLGKIAQALQVLRLPAVVVGLASLIAMTVIIFTSKSHGEDVFLIPSVVGVLWAITTYSLVVGFSSVPQKAEQSWKFLRRVKRKFARAWYGLLAIVFLGTSIVAVSVTYRMISIWIRDYLE